MPLQPPEPFEILPGRLTDLHPTIGVVGPGDRQFFDLVALSVGNQQQLGVEEPGRVLHERDDLVDDAPSDPLEAALGVAEADTVGYLDDQVVGAGDQIALEAAGRPRLRQQPRADGHVVAAAKRLDKGRKRREIGREVDIHVADDVGVALGPSAAERSAAALLVEVDEAHLAWPALGQLPRDVQRAIGRGVVGNDDPPFPTRLVVEQALAQRGHTLSEVSFLVVDRDD